MDAAPSGLPRAIVGKPHANNDTGYTVLITPNAQVMLWLSDGTDDYILPTSSNAVPIGSWAHIACVYDGSTTKIYVNGVEIASGTPTITKKPARCNV